MYLRRLKDVAKKTSFLRYIWDVLKTRNFIKREALAQAFSCGFSEISKNTFLTEHLWGTASVNLWTDWY